MKWYWDKALYQNILKKVIELRKTTKVRIIIVAALLIAAAVTAAVCGRIRGHGGMENEKAIEVTAEEMSRYRELIGSSMDIKKAVFILFEDEEQCKAFIDKHGADKAPQTVGEGTVPLMENGYYNIVGKLSVEAAFDKLNDGEYAKEPVQYSGMYCYLKRIGVESPVDSDKKLKEIILKNKKAKGEK